ncbi:MAG: flagellar basal body rod protein FlgB [Bacteroidales bacterium]|nr:flagellar basal body rod protein FlgB [Clostridium sp.]MCM1202717.1 flagellar basal body rod protein FlgB [Bacteroidales bacterium]
MINTNIYNYINVLDKAADAANSRGEILNNNLANATTPNYKRKDVSFENYLEQELIGGEPLDERIAGVNTHLSDFGGLIYTDTSTLSYRLDGNNVDVDTEEAMLAQNQIRYNTLVSQIGQEFSRYKMVLSET